MSRKKTVIPNNDIFVNNINLLVSRCGGYKRFSEKIKCTADTVRSWCLGEFYPGGAALLEIQKNFDVSLDWLLTGKSPNLTDPISAWPENIQDAYQKVREIFESKDSVVTGALVSNIVAFHDSIKKNKKNKALEKKVDELQKEVTHIKKMNEPGSRTGTD